MDCIIARTLLSKVENHFYHKKESTLSLLLTMFLTYMIYQIAKSLQAESVCNTQTPQSNLLHIKQKIISKLFFTEGM
uniref:Uncharacterized protein n=1 Tax=Rhizophora mucronata TaxID=61149 RepID=A0A2P2KXA6_RHIMU